MKLLCLAPKELARRRKHLLALEALLHMGRHPFEPHDRIDRLQQILFVVNGQGHMR